MTHPPIRISKAIQRKQADFSRFAATLFLLLSLICTAEAVNTIPKWNRLEIAFTNSTPCENPVQDIRLSATFSSPSGRSSVAEGFWDGGMVWRIRFSPDETGEWHYATQCQGTTNLQNLSGAFQCVANTNQNCFATHGPVKVANHGRSLVHEDGSPFFWLADTTWNGPLLSDGTAWNKYLEDRASRNFSAIQFSATPGPGSSHSDRNGLNPFSGFEKIAINPEYFRQLDGKLDAINTSGLLAAPVLNGAIGSGSPLNQPGSAAKPDLPVDQAIILTRYMAARWGANPVIWILNATDEKPMNGERSKFIGRGVFGAHAHAPVILYSGAMQWMSDDLLHENWIDIIGYGSPSDTNETAMRTCFSGPQNGIWPNRPTRPLINLGPIIEDASNISPENRDSSFTARRAMYWSLLSTPTAGVSFGNQAVLEWKNEARALHTPGADQVTHLVRFFTSIPFWRLRPAQDMLAADPGLTETRRHIAVARTLEGDLAVIYVPEDRTFQIRLKDLPPSVETSWTDPRNGSKRPVIGMLNGENIQFSTPGPGDWLMLLKSETK